ncbi:MAG: hypothetical protein HRU23_09825 [Gammaproteobacteria bacterium]|nr:hypothetical protein [Gammaproteobacteria bacterium]
MRLALYSLVLLLTFSGAVDALPKQLTFGYIKDSQIALAASNVLFIAYQRIGIDVMFIGLPAKRSLQQSDSVLLDGEVLRVANIENSYRNLIAIPVSMTLIDGVAYTISKSIKFADVDDLLNYRIGIHSGMLWQESFVQHSQGPHTRVNSATSLFKLLIANRVDYVLLGRAGATELMNSTFANKNIVEVSPAVRHSQLFHYVHRKHLGVIPLITKQLESMQVSGELVQLLAAGKH